MEPKIIRIDRSGEPIDSLKRRVIRKAETGKNTMFIINIVCWFITGILSGLMVSFANFWFTIPIILLIGIWSWVYFELDVSYWEVYDELQKIDER